MRKPVRFRAVKPVIWDDMLVRVHAEKRKQLRVHRQPKLESEHSETRMEVGLPQIQSVSCRKVRR